MFARLLHDFWPPDASSIGPNLVASAVCFAGGWFWKGRILLAHLDELHRHHGIGKYKETK